MHTIGIDFGTTKTLVSYIKSRTGEAETVRLGQGTDHISTSVFIKDNGEMLFGDEADDRLTEADGVYLRGFKMSLGNSTPVYVQMNDEGELIQYMAAEQGYARAQYKLGLCYEKGEGVKKNRQKAKEWYFKAAAQGMKEAEKALKNL